MAYGLRGPVGRGGSFYRDKALERFATIVCLRKQRPHKGHAKTVPTVLIYCFILKVSCLKMLSRGFSGMSLTVCAFSVGFGALLLGWFSVGGGFRTVHPWPDFPPLW